jgi:prolyl-tRNA synthetase
MKDSYSFDKDQAGLDRSFQNHFDAYRKIYERCGIETIAVQASSGAMGGSESVEFMVETDAGEDWVAACAACGYAANVEKATSLLPDATDPESVPAAERFPTPGVRTIDDLARMSGGAAADRQIKTLVYVLDGATTLVLLRGDHQLVLQKLLDGTGAREARPAHAGEIRAALGASAGSLGAVGASSVRVIADATLHGRRGMTTGANADDFHLRNVDIARDIAVAQWLDLRLVMEGEPCPMCEAKLAVRKTVEVGHIFKLGTKYSETLGASIQAEDGKNVPIIMGSYGIGVGRLLAAIVERCHDASGIKWPVNVAPYEVAVTVLNPKDVATHEAGENLYETLTKLGVDTILDDRDERPGVKFKDAELIGIPVRVTVGPKGLASGKLEVFFRGSGEKREIDVHKAADFVSEAVFEGRRR